MYDSYDGDSNVSNKVVGNESEFPKLQEEVVESVHSSEPIFRGFEKLPKVLCQRIDITPYLSKYYLPSTSDDQITMTSESITYMAKLVQKCSVVLVRDDLEKLQNIVNTKLVNGESCLKCKICSKVYSSEKKLNNHQENKHLLIYRAENKSTKRVSFSDRIIVHEVKEYHSCRKCPKIFENYEKLKLHMRHRHKKRRCYICFYCSKEFVDRTFFKVHIKLHCDVCGLLLLNRKSYLEHRRNICKIIKKYECKTCHCSFFNFMDLKDHSYEHLGTFYVCDICKDQFQSKCEVGHHINFSHTKNRLMNLYETKLINSSDLYMCNFCEESFVKEETVKTHVSTLPDLQNEVLTGYRNFFFCEKCFKKFSTETDMLQHKWLHYLKTSDNSQLRNNKIGNVTSITQVCKKPSKNIKTIYKMDEKLPELLQPKLVLERVKVQGTVAKKKHETKATQFVDMSNLNFSMVLNKPVVDPISKKTIISRHRCQECGKYLSSNYCLNRHMNKVHATPNTNLQCTLCEEIFVWPSLLQSHKCIRMNIPEMAFDDARPEVHFDNIDEIRQNELEDFNIPDEDYTAVDFEIPAPIVQLTEFENLNIVVNSGNRQLNDKHNDKTHPFNGLSYKVVMQEVPIEF